MNEEAMSAWIEENFKSNLDVIEDLSYAQIKQMVVDREYVLIYACKSTKLVLINLMIFVCLRNQSNKFLKT